MEGDFLDRLSESLKSHEEERRSDRKDQPRYQRERELGRGGMGVVYEAFDTQLGRKVALKVLDVRAGNSAQACFRFMKEVEFTSALTHPNIVAVYDAGGLDGGEPFLALQLIDGTTLDNAGLTLKETLVAIRDAARAIHHAHEGGIVHRDIKPSNLLVDRQGRAYVSDFGVARRVDVDAKVTMDGQVIGTPAYMSPEQASGCEVDRQCDVYSLGATMYEVVAGKPPYSESDAKGTLRAVIARDPLMPREVNPDVPSAVQKIVLGAMRREREHRYPTAAHLADDIDRYFNKEPLWIQDPPWLWRAKEFVRKRRGSVISAAAVLAVVVAVALSSAVWRADPDLRKLERTITQGSLQDAKKRFRELEPTHGGDERFEELRVDLEREIEEQLRNARSNFKRTLLDANFIRAEEWLAEMEKIPFDGNDGRIKGARKLLGEAMKEFKSFENLTGAFNKLLDAKDYSGARDKLDLLQNLKILELKQPFTGAPGIIDGLRGRLIDALSVELITSEDWPLTETSRLLEAMDRGAHLKAFKRREERIWEKIAQAIRELSAPDLGKIGVYAGDNLRRSVKIALSFVEKVTAVDGEIGGDFAKASSLLDALAEVQLPGKLKQEGEKHLGRLREMFLAWSARRKEADERVKLIKKAVDGKDPGEAEKNLAVLKRMTDLGKYGPLEDAQKWVENLGKLQNTLHGLLDDLIRSIGTDRFESIYRKVLDANFEGFGSVREKARVALKGHVEELLLNRRPQDAMRWLGEKLVTQREDSHTRELRGIAHRDSGSWPKAAAEWEKALDGAELLQKTRLLRRLGRIDDGASALSIGKNGDAETLMLLGQFRYLKDDKSSALRSFTRVEKLLPKDPSILYWVRATEVSLSASGGWKNAKDLIGKAPLARNRKGAGDHAEYHRALLFIESGGGCRIAEGILNGILNRGPVLTEEEYVFGRYELEKRSRPGAELLFKAGCHVLRARARYLGIVDEEGNVTRPADLEPCFEDCERALEILPGDPMALLHRGIVHFWNVRDERALKDLVKVRDSGPQKLAEDAKKWIKLIEERK